MATKTGAHTFTYTGPDRVGAASTGEILRTGDTVQVHRLIETAIAGRRALVDLPSDAYGTGRTYTTWNIPAEEVGW